jgi:hypothetical protein
VENEDQGVYKIPCKDCNQVYVGQSNRRVSTRIAEHQLSVKKRDKVSALSIHNINTGHSIDFDNSKTIATTYNHKNRLVRERIEIYKYAGSAMNKRNDGLGLPASWTTILTPYTKTRTGTQHSKQLLKADSRQPLKFSPN